jgi:hypothetical protein
LVFDRISTWTVTAFYKGESQEKKLLLRPEEAGMFAFSPAHVMLVGSGFFFLQIHLLIVTTLSASDANKQGGGQMPTMVLSEARGL